MENKFYDLYFKNNFNNFCLICGKNSNSLSCQECNILIDNLDINNYNKINFFKNYYYWMHGKNIFNEKIKSYGLYCIQRKIPINTYEILKYIKKINFIKENKNKLKIEIITNNNTQFNILIPKVTHNYEHFISYKNLFLYPELC